MRRRSIAGAALLSALLALPAGAATSSGPLASVARRSDMSIAVAAGGELFYKRNARHMRAPASVQKLLLTMALFDALGPRHRIATRVVANTEAGGRVGDLWIVGGGDPTMVSGPGSRRDTGLDELARKIHRSGVRSVTGSVIADASLFRPDWTAPGWQPWSRDFAARPAALSLDGNGHTNPPLSAATELSETLRRRGVSVRHQARTGKAPRDATEIARTRSTPLHMIVNAMNESSSNFTAEMLGKLLGASVFGPPGTISKGARAIERWAASNGVTVMAHDSSGLSYGNRVSAGGVVRLLEAARREVWGSVLYRSLPSPGEGTLGSRLRGYDVHAKTGTIWSGDSALAGWVRLRGGGIAEFAVLARNEPKSLEDAVVEAVATSAWVPPATARH